ncbi:MAG: nucleotidyltransferase domain-containing protein [Chloroflexi bacterium]|nr:nucleotidyltransferase domain-containing protein [Chloroflexota bacterium]MCI0579610.1 nucleotidyltransferase domain-containing protein [Chloroflexota bacterium]MCI0644829.1 nucleotidyltransferase domain-containing protein [Chloroflexota bacterium]MCI0731445.1 nucleotidyltransferase domain-containing protein [Chloroflexota bacterium]
MNPEDLTRQLKQILPALLGERPVMIAYLFGSMASGRTTPFSDVDIALVLKPDHGLSKYEQLMLSLTIEAELEPHLRPLEPDVRVLNDAPLAVQGKVLTKGKLLYSRDDDFRVEYEVYTRKLYFDFQPVLEMMRKAYFARQRTNLPKQ